MVAHSSILVWRITWAGYHPWGHKKLDRTEWASTHILCVSYHTHTQSQHTYPNRRIMRLGREKKTNPKPVSYSGLDSQTCWWEASSATLQRTVLRNTPAGRPFASGPATFSVKSWLGHWRWVPKVGPQPGTSSEPHSGGHRGWALWSHADHPPTKVSLFKSSGRSWGGAQQRRGKPRREGCSGKKGHGWRGLALLGGNGLRGWRSNSSLRAPAGAALSCGHMTCVT